MITRKDLSEEQENALKHMLSFVKNPRSPVNEMVLAGYAGTGKTSLVNVFLNEVGHNSLFTRCYCTAPTNEAVRVISKAVGRTYEMTIYSLLGLVLVEENGERARIQPKGKPKIHEYDVIILDEASMIGDELLGIIRQYLKKYSHLKVIYVGDSAQLPPIVTSEENPNISRNSFGGVTESAVFSISNKVELNQVQRVAKGNPIISVVTPIRENLGSKTDCFPREDNIVDGIGVQFFDKSNEYLDLLFEDFLSKEYSENYNYVRAIGYTNAMVNKLNHKIRAKIFKNETPDEYVVGEVLIVASPVFVPVNPNVKKIELTVGERIKVRSATLIDDCELGMDIWDLTVIKNGDEYEQEIKLKVVAKDSQDRYITILHALADSAKMKLSETRLENGKRKHVYNGGEAWREYYAFKERYCRLKYSYAMTTHTSQGATVERVYVIERDLNILSWNDVIRNKLKYTAFTRASKLLRVLT